MEYYARVGSERNIYLPLILYYRVLGNSLWLVVSQVFAAEISFSGLTGASCRA
jgi:hypothetical protein